MDANEVGLIGGRTSRGVALLAPHTRNDLLHLLIGFDLELACQGGFDLSGQRQPLLRRGRGQRPQRADYASLDLAAALGLTDEMA